MVGSYYDKCDVMLDQEDGIIYTIISPNFPFTPTHGEDMTLDDWPSILMDKGWVVKGDTVAELAAALNMDAAKLQESVDFYNERQKTTPADRFGTPIMPLEEGQPLYAIQTQVNALDTLYGFKQDAQFRVLNTDGNPIENLYAAGWVGGGNYMLQKYYCTINAIAVYGGLPAGQGAIAALNAQ